MRTSSATRRPRGPQGRPLVGNALQAHGRALEFMTELAQTYGDVVYYEFLTEPIYQLTHPDDIESVLVTNNQQFVKSHLTRDVLGPVVGTGLFTSEGTRWRDQRQLVQPVFEPKEIATYAGLMVECAERSLETWTDGDRIDVHGELLGLTLDVVARALLGVDIRRDVETIGRNLEVVLGYLGSVEYHVRPEWAPTPGNRRFKRALAELDAIVDRLITERRSDPDGDDVLSRLLAATDERGEPTSTTQLRNEVMTFLVAGHETTALALTYTCYLLSTHPEAEGHLVDELATILDGRPPSLEDASDLTYTEQVVTESLRLYPPASQLHREPLEDVVVGGCRIPAGATVALPQWVVHRDPRWYPDPLAFRPERWTDEFRAELPRFAYFPFGGGPRRCIADRFALLEATLVLATIFQRYHLELRPETTFAVESSVTTRPKHPVWMTVHERTREQNPAS